MSYRSLLLAVAVVGLAVGIAFGGGIALGRNTAPETIVTVTSSGGGSASQGRTAPAGQSATPTPAPTGAAGGFGIRPQGGTPVTGTVKSVEGNIVTVSTSSGETKVQVGEATAIRKIESGALSDVSIGASIVAVGQPNAEGAVVAASIEIGSASP